MIRIKRPRASRALTAEARQQLAQKQTTANGYARQDSQIEPTWTNFRRTKVGKEVFTRLSKLFHSKCAFCERVNSRSIDHFYPKERYPRKMFRWPNFLLVCAECNQAKGVVFPLFNRKPVLIDPTRDDPLEFYLWDLTTGAICDSPDPSRANRARATRVQLRLNEDPLCDERRIHLNRVRYCLSKVVNAPGRPTTEDVDRLRDELSPARPNLGIIRFLFLVPNTYTPLVDAARKKLPEINEWLRRWA